MERYLMTHSLLSSWLYCMKENPYEDATSDKDHLQEFLQVLRREPTETTEAMKNGLDFENLVDSVVHGYGDSQNRWYEAAKKIADRVRGGFPQVEINRQVEVSGYALVLHGRLDWLKAGEIVDVKFTKNYDPGEFFTSTQHPMYFALVPEAQSFTYMVSNGIGVWPETYRRDESPSIFPIISDFLEWLTITGHIGLYKTYWLARGGVKCAAD